MKRRHCCQGRFGLIRHYYNISEMKRRAVDLAARTA
jgi:hypothetical protein